MNHIITVLVYSCNKNIQNLAHGKLTVNNNNLSENKNHKFHIIYAVINSLINKKYSIYTILYTLLLLLLHIIITC